MSPSSVESSRIRAHQRDHTPHDLFVSDVKTALQMFAAKPNHVLEVTVRPPKGVVERDVQTLKCKANDRPCQFERGESNIVSVNERTITARRISSRPGDDSPFIF